MGGEWRGGMSSPWTGEIFRRVFWDAKEGGVFGVKWEVEA